VNSTSQEEQNPLFPRKEGGGPGEGEERGETQVGSGASGGKRMMGLTSGTTEKNRSGTLPRGGKLLYLTKIINPEDETRVGQTIKKREGKEEG